ncbi:ABC transporter substrate-binding protein [Butyrivibrio sp. NC2007]|uniref:ABC transporter substrate-binding protein n=1 Tax=Butyrivibrio sp. NC2007 TaxID=1280683 RepID=UPI0003B629FE|nr:extracellular solute-binding protein [Butyrivibrio sp. NC2007]
MKKKMISLLLACSMLGTLITGCGSAEPATSDSGAATQQTTETAKADTSDNASSDEQITLTMMFSGVATEGDFETEVLPKLVKEKFPNIDLEVTKLPDDQYYTALKTKLASGECPDIILVQPKYAGSNSVIELAKAGYLLDISDLEFLDKAGDAAKEAFSYDGKVYGVAQGVSILGTYYNKKMFEDNNLTVPKTWDEFLNCCEVLKNAGIQPIVMGDKDAYVMQFGLYQIAANEIYPQNGNYDDQLRTGETHFTDEGTWDKVLSMYGELYEKGYVIDSSLGLGAAQSIQMFVDGEAAMTFDGSFNASALCAAGAVDFERGYFPLPAVNGDTYASMAPGGGPAVYSGTKHPDEVKAILNYWFDGESPVYQAFASTGNVLITYGYGADQNDPMYDEFMNLYNQGKAWYWCNQAWPAGTENEMEALFGSMIGGQGTTVPDITNGMQNKLEELLDQ